MNAGKKIGKKIVALGKEMIEEADINAIDLQDSIVSKNLILKYDKKFKKWCREHAYLKANESMFLTLVNKCR